MGFACEVSGACREDSSEWYWKHGQLRALRLISCVRCRALPTGSCLLVVELVDARVVACLDADQQLLRDGDGRRRHVLEDVLQPFGRDLAAAPTCHPIRSYPAPPGRRADRNALSASQAKRGSGQKPARAVIWGRATHACQGGVWGSLGALVGRTRTRTRPPPPSLQDQSRGASLWATDNTQGVSANSTRLERSGEVANSPRGPSSGAAGPIITCDPGSWTGLVLWCQQLGSPLQGLSRSSMEGQRASGSGPPWEREVRRAGSWVSMLKIRSTLATGCNFEGTKQVANINHSIGPQGYEP